MVYCGKPSKGCSNCRERKVRDQKEPRCGQCEKRHLQCPGYRNLVDLMFRDESSHVINKATKTRPHRMATRSPDGTASVSPLPAVTVTSADSPVGPCWDQSATSSSVSPDHSNWALPPATSPSDASSSRGRRSLTLLTPTSSHWHSLSGSEHADYDSSDTRSSSDGDAGNFPSPDEGTWPRPSTSALYALPSSLEQQGMAYFFAQHVVASSDGGSSPRLFDFVFDIWRPARNAIERERDGVMAAMIAVGLAGLSGVTGCEETRDWAQTSYGAALRLTNQTLQVPGEAVRDTTMLSILLLSTYEMMTGRNPRAVTAWQNHVDGAATLAAMRGAGPFASESGARMFDTLSHIVFVNCVQMALPMPPALIKLRDELQAMIPSKFMWSIPAPFYNVLRLRYNIKCGALAGQHAIVEELVAADQELGALTAQLPEQWRYQPVRISRAHEAILGESCHVYASPTQLLTWNRLRSMRMLVHEAIIGEVLRSMDGRDIESLPPKHRWQLSRSVKTLESLRDAILATVPQHLGVVGVRHTSFGDKREKEAVETVTARKSARQLSSPKSPGSPPAPSTPREMTFNLLSQPSTPEQKDSESSDEAGARKFMTLAAAGNTIVWPLYLVGMSSSCTHGVRDYVLNCLLAIYQDTGFKEAYSVAKMVAAKEVMMPWSGLQLEDASLFDQVQQGAVDSLLL